MAPSLPLGVGAIVFTDAALVEDPHDLARLQFGLARMTWVKNLGKINARNLINKLAPELLHYVWMARAGLPPLQRRLTASQAAKPRKRRQGGGRKPSEAKALLMPGVEKAMIESGYTGGRWHRNGAGGASPLNQVADLCWAIASGSWSARAWTPSNRTADFRRLMAPTRRWAFV